MIVDWLFLLLTPNQNHVLMPITIAIGASLGALSRYYFVAWSKKYIQVSFPLGTLLVNLQGSFLMGFLAYIFGHRFFSGAEFVLVQKFVFVGFLSSFTTFSSYILDSYILLDERRYFAGLLYFCSCPVLGLIALELGFWFAGQIS